MKKFIFIIVAMSIFVLFSGCSPKQNPKDTVNLLFSAIQNFELEKVNSLMQEKSNNLTKPEEDKDIQPFLDYLKSNAKKVSYEIVSSDIKDDTAIMQVKYKSVDAKNLMQETVQQYFMQGLSDAFSGVEKSEEEYGREFEKLFIEKTKNTEEAFKEGTTEVRCIKVDGKWYIEKLNDDLISIIYSNIINSVDSLANTAVD